MGKLLQFLIENYLPAIRRQSDLLAQQNEILKDLRNHLMGGLGYTEDDEYDKYETGYDILDEDEAFVTELKKQWEADGYQID